MPVTINFYQTRDFIRFDKSGEVDLETTLGIVRELGQAIDKHNCNCLIDVRTEKGTLSASEILKIVNEFVLYWHSFRKKLALLIKDNPQRIANAEYFENAMEIKEFSVKCFLNFEEAMDWLSDISKLYSDVHHEED